MLIIFAYCLLEINYDHNYCANNNVNNIFYNYKLKSKQKIETYRDSIAYRLRNYTCADESLKTTEPLRTYSMEVFDKTFLINVLFDTAHAKIWFFFFFFFFFLIFFF
jgi:hypothetical protein